MPGVRTPKIVKHLHRVGGKFVKIERAKVGQRLPPANVRIRDSPQRLRKGHDDIGKHLTNIGTGEDRKAFGWIAIDHPAPQRLALRCHPRNRRGHHTLLFHRSITNPGTRLTKAYKSDIDVIITFMRLNSLSRGEGSALALAQAITTQEEKPPRTAKAQATREKLMAAAERVFGSAGFEAARVADIVAEAGVSHGLFYRHFADKAAILIAVLTRLNDDLRHTSGREPGGPLAPTLDQLQTRNILFFREYAEHRCLFRVSREAAARNDAGDFRTLWLAIRNRFSQRTCRWIEDLSRAGHIGPVIDPEMLAETLSAMTEQMAYVHLGLAQDPPDDALIERLGRSCGLVWHRAIFGRAA